MRPAVVPRILAELEKEPDHWFWALDALTDENPVAESDAGDVEASARVWGQCPALSLDLKQHSAFHIVPEGHKHTSPGQGQGELREPGRRPGEKIPSHTPPCKDTTPTPNRDALIFCRRRRPGSRPAFRERRSRSALEFRRAMSSPHVLRCLSLPLPSRLLHPPSKPR